MSSLCIRESYEFRLVNDWERPIGRWRASTCGRTAGQVTLAAQHPPEQRRVAEAGAIQAALDADAELAAAVRARRAGARAADAEEEVADVYRGYKDKVASKLRACPALLRGINFFDSRIPPAAQPHTASS